MCTYDLTEEAENDIREIIRYTLRAWGDSRRDRIFKDYDYRQQEFLRFVLGHYVQRGVGELDTSKLPQLIELKYHSVADAVRELGSVNNIREVFVGFQRHLY